MEDPTHRLKQITTGGLWLGVPGDARRNLSDAMMAVSEARDEPTAINRNPKSFPAGSYGKMPFIPEGKDILLDGLIQEPASRITHLGGVFTPASDWSDLALLPTKLEAPLLRYRSRKAWVREVVEGGWGWLSIFSVLAVGLFAKTLTAPGQRPGWKWCLAAILLALGVFACGLYDGAVNTVFVKEYRVERLAPGSPESFAGLLDTWVRSLTTPP